MIARYLLGEELRQPGASLLPGAYIEPSAIDEEELEEASRVEPPMLSVEARRHNFNEIEVSLSVEDALKEARRCLRCDLEFTRPKEAETASAAAVGETV